MKRASNAKRSYDKRNKQRADHLRSQPRKNRNVALHLFTVLLALCFVYPAMYICRCILALSQAKNDCNNNNNQKQTLPLTTMGANLLRSPNETCNNTPLKVHPLIYASIDMQPALSCTQTRSYRRVSHTPLDANTHRLRVWRKQTPYKGG